jgi:hypothetical protein
MVTRLTGGNSPGDGADPRTFPVVYDELVDFVEGMTPVVPVDEAAYPADPVPGTLYVVFPDP